MSISRTLYKAVLSSRKESAAGTREDEDFIYIYDDPLSAVDVHVGKDIFETAFVSLLEGETRVVALSSNYHFLPYFDHIIVMEAGRIACQGTYAEIVSQCVAYSVPGSVGGTEGDSIAVLRRGVIERRQAAAKVSASVYRDGAESIINKRTATEALMTIEDKENGSVKLSTYLLYFTAAVGGDKIRGAIVLSIILFIFLIAQLFRIVSDIWMGTWANDKARAHPERSDSFYFACYIGLVPLLTVFTLVRSIMFVHSCVAASKNMHSSLLSAVFR